MSDPVWEVRAFVSRAEDVLRIAPRLPKGSSLKLYAHTERRLRLLRLPSDLVSSITFSDAPIATMLEGPYEGKYVTFIPPGVDVDALFYELCSTSFEIDGADVVYSKVLCESSGRIFTPSKSVLGIFAARTSRIGRPRCTTTLSKALSKCSLGIDEESFILVDARPDGFSIKDKVSIHNLPGSFDDVEKKKDEDNGPIRKADQSIDIIDSAPMLDIAYFGDLERSGDWRFVESRSIPDDQERFEREIREMKAHWIAIRWGDGKWNWRTVTRTAFCHMDKDIIAFPGLTLVHPGRFRLFQPIVPDVKRWTADVKEYAYSATFDAEGSPIEIKNAPEEPVRSGKKLKVAVLSMCGVTTFEDRYGLGGEHQVVHWLREAFLRHPDVELCDAYDTSNVMLAPHGFYDLILSNSCWAKPPRKAPNGVTIFWHFNTNCYRGNEGTVQAMGYDVVWTNSPSSLNDFHRVGIDAKIKHLNASSEHHHRYPWESKLFRHDACYIGGYQVEYKGKDLIDSYTKPLMTGDMDFVIYGNRKWRADVQRSALQTDRYFKQEHLDESFEPFYRGVLHPDDFRILAKNCKVMVNFNSADQRPLGMVNDRPIWLMGCGGFVVTDDSPEQRALYGNTCDYSTGGEDLHRKVSRWLEDDAERQKRREEAYKNIVAKRLFTNDTASAAIEEYARR